MLSSKARTILAAAVALTGACSNDSPTDPPVTSSDPGAVRFSYSGSGLTGTFAAQGKYNVDPAADPTAQSFAVAIDFGSGMTSPFYEVVALKSDTSTFDLLGILLSAQKTGAYPVMTEDDCNGPSLQTACALAWFILGISAQDDGTQPLQEYVLTSGTVTVSSASNGRLKGTFQGSAQQIAAGGGSTGPFVPDVAVEVVSGTFDVPVLGDQGWILLPDRLPAGGATLLRGDRRPAFSAWDGVRRARLTR